MRAEHFSADVRDLLRLLVDRNVRFMIVGGEAVIYHGYPRVTGDVDLWYEQTAENSERLFAALAIFWDGRVPGVDTSADFLRPGVVVQFGRPPHRIDLLSVIDGVDFADAWQRRKVEMLVDECGRGTSVAFIGVTDLIRNKRASGRHKDLDDVEHLSAIASSEQKPSS
jgi:predicted nucleotidyltransferase